MNKGCLNCGASLEGLNKGAKFCHKRCRNSYRYKTKTKKGHHTHAPHKKEESLKGIEPEIKSEILDIPGKETHIEDKKILENKLPPLRNTVWLNKGPEKRKASIQDHNEAIKKEPPPQFLTKTSQYTNPEYEKREWMLKKAEGQKAELLSKLQKLEVALKDQMARDGSGLVVGGALTGVGITLLSSKEGDIASKKVKSSGKKKNGS